MMEKLNSGIAQAGLVLPTIWMAPAIVYGIYLLPTLSWLSRKMEYEADLYASMGSQAADPNHMLDALVRFASFFPEQLDKKSIMHPSLRQRIDRIVKIRENQFDHAKFTSTWRKQKIYLLVSTIGICLTAILV